MPQRYFDALRHIARGVRAAADRKVIDQLQIERYVYLDSAGEAHITLRGAWALDMVYSGAFRVTA